MIQYSFESDNNIVIILFNSFSHILVLTLWRKSTEQEHIVTGPHL